jgi:hypothetical protein
MPLTTEQEREKEKTRRRGRPWLWALLGVGALLLPLVPLVHPIEVQMGGWVLQVTWLHEPGLDVAPGYYRSSIPRPPGGTTHVNSIHYRVDGPVHEHYLALGEWMYHLLRFRGRRLK